MGKRIDLTGQRFGRLEVIHDAGRDKQNSANWKCCCECGNNIVVSSHSLRSGNTKSCGCLQKDIIKEIGYSNQIHGMSHTKIWRRWRDMKRRCFDNKVKAFKNYGGRGITVCKEWLNFEVFYKWAMENGYRDDLTIERTDNSGNYDPENCTFIPKPQQSKNRRGLHFVIFNGEKKTLNEWSRTTGIDRRVLGTRLRRGWSINRTLTTLIDKGD